MSYVIDGYNLLHALGALHGRLGPAGLKRARDQLLEMLHRAHDEEAGQVTVVFDAKHSPPGLPAEETYRGLRVCYAVHQDQADDLIEFLIQHDSVPRQLTVVSDDHRLQRAARRRGCIVLGCQEYLDELERRRSISPRVENTSEKPEGATDKEQRLWLGAFADLEDDPDLKELFDPFGFQTWDPESADERE
jgi:predicted RNA-binding protein with PIN domain